MPYFPLFARKSGYVVPLALTTIATNYIVCIVAIVDKIGSFLSFSKKAKKVCEKWCIIIY
jgi:hypothetical protein